MLRSCMLVGVLLVSACVAEDSLDAEDVAAADPVGALMTLSGGPGVFDGRNGCTITVGRSNSGNGFVQITENGGGSGLFTVAPGGDCTSYPGDGLRCNYWSVNARNNPSDQFAADDVAGRFYGSVHAPVTHAFQASCNDAARRP